MALFTSSSDPLPFFRALDDLVARHKVIIDRAQGTAHPRFPEAIYPLDYGYLEGTRSGDGSGIDVWVGSMPQGLQPVTGAVVTVDLAKADSEIKVLLGCTKAQMLLVLEWHNRGEQRGLLVERPAVIGSRLAEMTLLAGLRERGYDGSPFFTQGEVWPAKQWEGDGNGSGFEY